MNESIDEIAKELKEPSTEYNEIDSANAKTRDSVFYKLFQIKENVFQLYKELHPEDTNVSIDDVKIKTLTAIFVNYLYNDLGFMVDRNGTPHYIILVEAQTKWNRNITMRILWYLAVTYHRYVKETGQNIHDTSKINVPAPELYLVYTGDDLKNVPDEINIRDEMFGGEGSIDLRVKVLHAPSNTILGQYIAFSKIYSEQLKLYGKCLKAVEETIRICLEHGILVEFLKEYGQEVKTMLMTLFNEEAQREEYDETLKKKSLEQGIKIGEKKGIEIGEKKGIEIGEKKGIEIGEKKGIEIGEKKGIEIGKLKALVDLVKDGLLSLADAAKRSDMTETEFANLPDMKQV